MQTRKECLSELEALLTGFWLTDLANFSAHFYHSLPELNWIGFYLSDGKQLRLGPFAGRTACTEIAFNRGVCGTAFSKKEITIVPDVHAFPGHIACDPRSLSELVLPFFLGEECVGVLDLDSPLRDRFQESDASFMKEALQILERKLGPQGRLL